MEIVLIVLIAVVVVAGVLIFIIMASANEEVRSSLPYDDDEDEFDDESAEGFPAEISDRAYKDQFKRAGFGDSGKWARFAYADADGRESRRQIVNWQQRGPYIVGYDRSKKGERTFRQDRISDWQAG